MAVDGFLPRLSGGTSWSFLEIWQKPGPYI